MDFWLFFTCSARYCELLPGDLGCSADFLQHLIEQALTDFHARHVQVSVELQYLMVRCAYEVHIRIQFDARVQDFPSTLEALRVEMEVIVSQAMLQCFWEIHCSER